MTQSSTYDVVVVGAGVFGSWTAWHLAKRKLKVLVLDAYGAAHPRASSGGETRIIRMSYADDARDADDARLSAGAGPRVRRASSA